jgi:hypothetical protein
MQIPSPMAWLHRSGSWWHRPPCRAVRGADLIISTWADLGGFADNSLCFLVPAPSVGPWSWSLAHCIHIYYDIIYDITWLYMILYDIICSSAADISEMCSIGSFTTTERTISSQEVLNNYCVLKEKRASKHLSLVLEGFWRFHHHWH